MSSLPPSIHATAVTISWDLAKGSKPRLTLGELRIGPHSYKLIEDNGTLRLDFPSVLNLLPSTRITLCYKTSRSIVVRNTHEVNTSQLFANFSASQTQDLHHGIRVVFNCRTEPAEGVLPTTNTDRTLSSTMDAILEDCPQFRILVIGKSGVGKSSLIHATFGIDAPYSSDFVRGRANINVGLKSAVNERLILHNSLGFEPADSENYDTVKEFIRNRQTGQDRLHAIWFCVPIPRAGACLLDTAAKNFFETNKETMGTIPLIVVYTKLDSFVDHGIMKLATPQVEPNAEKDAQQKAESHAKECNDEISKLAGVPLPHVVVSNTEKYKHTLQKLVELTYDHVGIRDTPELPTPTGVTLIAAQRVDTYLKVKGTIDVGRQRYWKALKTSLNFQGRKILEYLDAIHADIIAIWNFNDPAHHLSDKIFRELIVNMAQEVETVANSALSGRSLVAAVTGVLSATSNPAVPIVLPAVAGMAIALLPYRVYQNAKYVQQLFIAYIVDLTHILETLSILTGREHKRLTRRAIKAAYRAYYESDVRIRAHADIQDYQDLDGRDAVLEKIESLIGPERGENANVKECYARMNELDLGGLDLDEEERWFDQDTVPQ